MENCQEDIPSALMGVSGGRGGGIKGNPLIGTITFFFGRRAEKIIPKTEQGSKSQLAPNVLGREGHNRWRVSSL